MLPKVTLVNFKYLGLVKQGMGKNNERLCSYCNLTHSSCFSVASKYSTSELATVVSNGTPLRAYPAGPRKESE